MDKRDLLMVVMAVFCIGIWQFLNRLAVSANVDGKESDFLFSALGLAVSVLGAGWAFVRFEEGAGGRDTPKKGGVR